MTPLGVLLALGIGLVLGLLGGGGSILAVPTFLYVFHVEPKPAIAMSLVVVGMSALVGFITHWQQGTINVRIALGFGALAMTGSFGVDTTALNTFTTFLIALVFSTTVLVEVE